LAILGDFWVGGYVVTWFDELTTEQGPIQRPLLKPWRAGVGEAKIECL
jgi:hypothetical protein